MMRRAVSAWLAALLLVVTVAVPMLDTGEFSHEAAFESAHSAASCLLGHDHTICTQVGANLLVASEPVACGAPLTICETARSARVFTSLIDRYLDGRRSRAPPRV